MIAAGGDIRRVVAVGGGAQGSLWTQIVSDITGQQQELRTYSIGASYGGALLAAQLVVAADIELWNPVKEIITPREDARAVYDQLYSLYRQLYVTSAELTHVLAEWQERPPSIQSVS
jgi:xylulokinase